MNSKLSIGVPACNEEHSIVSCLESIALQTNLGKSTVIVCLNGCIDRTEERVREFDKRHEEIELIIVHSEQGLTFALNKIKEIAASVNPDQPLMFVDADVVLCPRFVEYILSELAKNHHLIVVGGWPVPIVKNDGSIVHRILERVLHIRAFHPEAEISSNEVSAYKNYAFEHPQSVISPEAEIRSKVYFHGRAYIFRRPSYFFLPLDKEIVDDTFLSNYIHTRYGPGTIRTRYDAIAYYEPFTNIRDHFLTYWRYYLDRKRLDQRYPQFANSRRNEETKLNWSYIRRCEIREIVVFICYAIVKSLEETAFTLLPRRKVSHMWSESKLRDM